MDYKKVEDFPNLVRDSKTNAIINKDQTSYKNYIYNRQIKQSQVNKIEKIEDDLNSLKSDINEIKNLLRNLSK